MGWTGMYWKPDNIPAWFKERWEREPKDGKTGVRCLGQAFVGRFTLYGVWEYYGIDPKPIQFATVVLVQYGTGREKFLYKDMDETVGPCEAKMPLSLLKLLKTPAYNEYARSWRKRCWQHALGLTYDSVRLLINRHAKRGSKPNWPKIREIAERFNRIGDRNYIVQVYESENRVRIIEASTVS